MRLAETIAAVVVEERGDAFLAEVSGTEFPLSAQYDWICEDDAIAIDTALHIILYACILA